jgi:hypothetical protein
MQQQEATPILLSLKIHHSLAGSEGHSYSVIIRGSFLSFQAFQHIGSWHPLAFTGRFWNISVTTTASKG